MTDPASGTSADNSQPANKAVAINPLALRSLTIPAKRLAGSPACLNCGTVLAGPFCHYCGQPDKNLLRFFPVLLRELLADFLDFDSRFVRTMKPLLLHPGKLSRDYLDGRRFRYTPPLRLYIFASMGFFLIAAMLASSAINLEKGENGEQSFFSFGSESDASNAHGSLDAAVNSGDMTETEAEELRQLLNKGGVSSKIDEATGTAVNTTPDPGQPEAIQETEPEKDTINLNGEIWDRETNPFILPLAPDFINNWINDEIEESPKKGREIEANPNLIVDKIMDVLPIAVFIMLPLVALLLKFWYLFSGHYYVEHLIHALHNHAFLFVVFIIMILTDAITSWVEPGTKGLWTDAAIWLDTIMLIWIPLYLLISLKKVYRQSWTLTLMKFSLVGISYMMLLVFVTSAAAVAGFVLL